MDSVGIQETFDRWHAPVVDLFSSTSVLNLNHSTPQPPQLCTRNSHYRWLCHPIGMTWLKWTLLELGQCASADDVLRRRYRCPILADS